MFSKLKNKFTKAPQIGGIEYIVAGLGNPGKEYENTRHNAGFLALDYIAEKENITIKQLKYKSLCGDGIICGKRVMLIKPSNYMNNSGEGIRDVMNFYKIPAEKLIVICDDIELDVGSIRVRRKGSDGGQKGLESIIYQLGKNNFPRVRIGIGKKPHPDMELADWVLSKLVEKDRKAIENRFPDIYKAVELIISGDISEAMNLFN